MSTAAEIKIVGDNGDPGLDNTVYLLHHSDGYPSYMVPVLKAAYRKFVKGADNYRRYKGGRAGHAAAFICAADPQIAEPEDCSEAGKWADLDYLYTLWVREKPYNPKTKATPVASWEVRIERVSDGGKEKYVVQERQPVLSLSARDD
jgi:hypothetical protein